MDMLNWNTVSAPNPRRKQSINFEVTVFLLGLVSSPPFSSNPQQPQTNTIVNNIKKDVY